MHQDMATGMALLGELPEVQAEDASGQLAELYDDIQATLRVPFVNFIFRALANFPDQLDALWTAYRPAFRSMQFEREADGLRDQAVPEIDFEVSGRDWRRLGDLEKIGPYTDSIHYVLPKLLLVAHAFTSRADEPTPTEPNGAQKQQQIPYGIAPGTRRLAMVDPQNAPSPVGELFEDIKQLHQHPGVASYFRALANWPAFLDAIWNELRPRIGTDAYNAKKNSLIEQAEQVTAQILTSATSRPAISDDVRAILCVFEHRLVPDLLLDVAMIEALLGEANVVRAP